MKTISLPTNIMTILDNSVLDYNNEDFDCDAIKSDLFLAEKYFTKLINLSLDPATNDFCYQIYTNCLVPLAKEFIVDCRNQDYSDVLVLNVLDDIEDLIAMKDNLQLNAVFKIWKRDVMIHNK